VGGAGLVVYNSGGTGEQASHYLSPEGWRATRGAAHSGYKYVGRRVNDPWIRAVTLRTDKVLVKGVVNYTLDEPAQGSIAVRLITLPTLWCGNTAARTGGTPPSTAKSDRAGKFVGQPGSPPPPACVPLPVGP
jgi:hypothetical protein